MRIWWGSFAGWKPAPRVKGATVPVVVWLAVAWGGASLAAEPAPGLDLASEPVRILLSSGAETVTLRTDAPIRLGREAPAGVYTFRASRESAPSRQHHLFVKTFPPDQGTARDAYLDELRGKGFQPEVVTLGRRFKTDTGHTLDGRVDWISIAREPTAGAAEARRKQLLTQGFYPWVQAQRLDDGRGFIQVRTASGEIVASFAAPLVIAPAAPVSIEPVTSTYWDPKRGPLTFAGHIVIRLGDERGLDVIESIPIEDYLRGVLPAEMSVSWPIEALKAQAVAARSDVVSNLAGRNALDGFDFFATEQSRAYQGASGRHTNTDEALRATQGEILAERGRVPPAVFSANCGGWTENNETVWFGPPDAALRGVPDAKRGANRTKPQEAPDRWLRERNSAYCAIDETYFRWTRAYTEPELRAIINKTVAVGRIEEIVLGERGVSGRLKSVRIRGSNATKTVEKELPIRRIFGNLPSALFVVSKSNGAGGTRYTFTGGGRGHGVGLCQQGARGMALQGESHREILRHYYHGATITRAQ